MPVVSESRYARPPLSADVPDWSREALDRWWDPGRQLLRSIRRYQRLRARNTRAARFVSKWYVLPHRFWSVVTGADIPLNAQLGGGLLIPHPNGIVIHPGAVVGPNCIFFQQVTLGTQHEGATPVIGGDVLIGAGAKVLGAVRVGDHAQIGANAVVVGDVPPYATATGIPAQIKAER